MAGELQAQMLARPRVFPIATAALCERTPNIATVEDLLQVPLIHEESTEQWAVLSLPLRHVALYSYARVL